MTPDRLTRAELERAAIEAGHAADFAFSLACQKLGLQVTVARKAPLESVILAELERAASV